MNADTKAEEEPEAPPRAEAEQAELNADTAPAAPAPQAVDNDAELNADVKVDAESEQTELKTDTKAESKEATD